MPRLGPLELAIILLIVLLIFGAGRLPQIGSSLGRSMKAFKNAITGQDEADDNQPLASKTVKSPTKDEEQP